MAWQAFGRDWPEIRNRLLRRFPRLDATVAEHPPADTSALAGRVAEAHDLTLFEAHQELEDFLLVESLARQVMDWRAGS